MATRNWLESCGSGREVGLTQDLWVSLETGGFGDEATGGLLPDATDVLEHLGFTLTYNQARENSEARSGRSVSTRLSGKKEVTWEGNFYIVPADPTGSNPNLPNIHKFLYGLFGAFDNTTDPLELVYSFVPCTDLSLRAYVLGTQYSQLGIGLFTDTATFSFPGDGTAQATFGGGAQDVLDAYKGTLDAPTVAANDAVLVTGEGKLYDVGSFVDVVDGTTGAVIAAAREITAIIGDTLTLSGAAFSAVAGDLITPAVLASTGILTSDNAMVGISGEVILDGSNLDCNVVSAEISVANNFTPKNNIFGTDKICGYLNDQRREVSISMELEMDASVYEIYRKAKKFETADIKLRLKPNNGDSAVGRTFTFHMPKVEFDIPAVEFPADGVVVLSFEGMALSSDPATPNDEMTLTVGPEAA